MQSYRIVTQLTHYGIVGLVINLVGYCTYLLITAFLLPPKLTMTLLYIIGVVTGFAAHRKITFCHRGNLPRAIVLYGIAHALGWAINYAILFIFSDQLEYPHQYVQGVAIIIVAAYLFVVLRLFVFSPQTEPEETAS